MLFVPRTREVRQELEIVHRTVHPTVHDPKVGFHVHIWASCFEKDIANHKLYHTHVLALTPTKLPCACRRPRRVRVPRLELDRPQASPKAINEGGLTRSPGGSEKKIPLGAPDLR